MKENNTIRSVLEYNHPIKEIKQEDRAPNVLDKKPDEHDAKSLIDIVDDFCEDGVLEEIEEYLKEQGKFVSYSYDDYAKPAELTLSVLLSALAVQRPISKKHLRKI